MKNSGAFFIERLIQISITLLHILITNSKFFAMGNLKSKNLNAD